MQKPKIFLYTALLIATLLLLFKPSVTKGVAEYISSLSPTSQLAKIKEEKMLRVGVLRSIIPQYANLHSNNIDTASFDTELAKYFSEYLGVKLVVINKNSMSELLATLSDHQVDLIVTGLNQFPDEDIRYVSTPPFYRTTQQLIYLKGNKKPKSLNNITQTIHIAADSPQIAMMNVLKKDYPHLKWQIIQNTTSEKLLRQLALRKIQYTIAENTTIYRLRRAYPKITTAFTVNNSHPIVWNLNQQTDKSLIGAVRNFIYYSTRNGLVERLAAKYYDSISHFDYYDTVVFLSAINTILPNYRQFFETYAKQYNIDWHLLAAISYQESNWDPNATSMTGVRGMMMLTNDTAKALGIINRLDPEQSIRGGTNYLRQLLNRLPKSIPNDEKIWFALAAYNMGYGHLLDARRLAEQNGDNKNIWVHVKKYLPLLSQKKYYSKLKYGKGKGYQAYDFVQSIQQYKLTLTGYLLENEKPKKHTSAVSAAILKQPVTLKKSKNTNH